MLATASAVVTLVEQIDRVAALSHGSTVVTASPGCYRPLSDEALRLAADLWASSMQQGQPIVHPIASTSMILAAQALTYVAQFVPAKNWNEILLALSLLEWLRKTLTMITALPRKQASSWRRLR